MQLAGAGPQLAAQGAACLTLPLLTAAQPLQVADAFQAGFSVLQDGHPAPVVELFNVAAQLEALLRLQGRHLIRPVGSCRRAADDSNHQQERDPSHGR